MTAAGRRRPAVDATAILPPGLRRGVIVVLVLLVLAPCAYILVASLMPDLEVASGTVVPSSVTLENWVAIWTTVPLAQGLTTSVVVCGVVAVVSALLAVTTAYVLVRFTFVGRVTFLRALVGLQSVPGTLLLLPLFVVYASAPAYLGVTVVGTTWGLMITYLTFALPFATWVMVTYIRGMPVELEEAGLLDGLSRVGVLRRIVLPLSAPGLIVAAIFSFLLGWNDVLFASVLTQPKTRTAAVVLQAFGASQEGGALPLYGQVMSSAVVCAVPVVILYLIFQRYLVGGLTGGLK
ncbi:carbohydrate ABC transporter permease [Pseudonocardia sp.]|uniref:carbohydrate ABC transporter permease n=1 Tax=Pseudonocardia sp. TaxID=60912 RepID=UPI002D99AA1A|nr:carbohydrate ABC transporter permease [Pseudonocardia sp.]